MTFITGPALAPKSDLLLAGNPDQRVRVKITRQTRIVRPLSIPLFVIACLLVVLLLSVGLLLMLQPITTVHRYQGFCTIPIKDLNDDGSYFDQPSYKVMPLRWNGAAPDVQLLGAPDVRLFGAPDVQLLGAADQRTVGDVIDALREQFDIADSVENISVMDNGRHVNFIHDFEANVTGIVDSERCFTMDLDLETVLPPEVLVLSIEGAAQFDVSRVRSRLRAALPALPPAAALPPASALPPAAAAAAAAAARRLADQCRDKPVYRLLKEEGLIIRKRGVDLPSHDYIQFAGRRVQEIEIANLAELLQREQDARLH